MGMLEGSFAGLFDRLTGRKPFPWQEALYERFATGQFPAVCHLPTGLGKTAVIPIWLIALASRPHVVPRRLVYVVNRRTVVDQATREAERVRQRLLDAPELREALGQLCTWPRDLPLAISTLRGQFADNAQWRLDPACPAIVVGTVDMIGSRLLFGGYACGWRSRPLHAGLLGQDTLLVHDEAHLEPAFQALLEEIEQQQRRWGELRPLRVMALSATARDSRDPFLLTPQDTQVPEVSRRLHARKTLRLHSVEDEKQLASRLSELARQHAASGQAILVYARLLEHVEKVASQLPQEQTRLLTGTLRGLERDRLMRDAVLARFLPPDDRPEGVVPQEGTVYLVATSAGETGINLSADHMVCDLTPLDSMIQRLGRVNRFGRGEAFIDVVASEALDDADPYDQARARTRTLLGRLGGDGSPAALAALPADACQAAFTPPPQIRPLTDVLLDAWALTTIAEPLPGRPPLADYLHGVAQWQVPDTYVAWRHEVAWLTDELAAEHAPEELLEDYPLKPHELLRDRYDRVFKHLQRLAAQAPQAPVWLWTQGRVVRSSLEELVNQGKEVLRDATVVLPPAVGGLTPAGLLDVAEGRADLDVADEWYADDAHTLRWRVRVWEDDPELEAKTRGMRLLRVLPVPASLAGEVPHAPEASDDDEPPLRQWRMYVRPAGADDEGSQMALQPQLLTDHQAQVERAAAALAAALKLPPAEAAAVQLAARHHDDGKCRVLWQRSIGNRGEAVLAKSAGQMQPWAATGYRHELGSLVDWESRPTDAAQPPDVQELALHLIAAHHGRARPCFRPDECFDPEHAEEHVARLVAQVPRRFARLQRRYGRWGLAYLESLLKAADAYASAGPPQNVS